jgi:hypothetical protein
MRWAEKRKVGNFNLQSAASIYAIYVPQKYQDIPHFSVSYSCNPLNFQKKRFS